MQSAKVAHMPICVWCLYLAADSVHKSLFSIRSVFNSRIFTDKQVDVTGISTVSFKRSFSEILWLLQHYTIQSIFRPNIVWCHWYQLLNSSWLPILITLPTFKMIWKYGSRRVWTIYRDAYFSKTSDHASGFLRVCVNYNFTVYWSIYMIWTLILIADFFLFTWLDALIPTAYCPICMIWKHGFWALISALK
jgi:hypothetical protein